MSGQGGFILEAMGNQDSLINSESLVSLLNNWGPYVTVVDELVARDAVAQVLARYCRAVDRLDAPLLRGCFHPDALHNAGTAEDFCTYALEVVASCVVTHHQIGQPFIRVDGEEAFSEVYYTAYQRLPDSGQTVFGEAAGEDVIVAGRYIERFERRDGHWRIAHRRHLIDWRRFEPPSDREFFSLPSDRKGARDRSDAVYEMGVEPSPSL